MYVLGFLKSHFLNKLYIYMVKLNNNNVLNWFKSKYGIISYSWITKQV